MKRHELIFWLDNKCPLCGHSAPVIYKPDLLNGPIEFSCASVNNPMRRNSPCYFKWSVAIELKKRKELINLLELADKYDFHIQEAKMIYDILNERI